MSNLNVLLHIPQKQNLVLPETYIVLLYFKSSSLYLINVNNKKRQNLQKLPKFKKQSLLYFCTIAISKKTESTSLLLFFVLCTNLKRETKPTIQLPFYRFLFFAQSKTNKRKTKINFRFIVFCFLFKLKQINEKAKINFRLVVFCFLIRVKQISEKQKSTSVLSFSVFCAN